MKKQFTFIFLFKSYRIQPHNLTLGITNALKESKTHYYNHYWNYF